MVTESSVKQQDGLPGVVTTNFTHMLSNISFARVFSTTVTKKSKDFPEFLCGNYSTLHPPPATPSPQKNPNRNCRNNNKKS